MSVRIFRIVTIVLSLLFVSQYPAQAQLGKAGAKFINKVLKKGGKESAKEGAEKVGKEITLDAATRYAAKRASKEAAGEAASKYLTKDAVKYSEAKMGRRMSEQAIKAAEKGTAAVRLSLKKGASGAGKDIVEKSAVRYFRPLVAEESGEYLARRELSRSAGHKAIEADALKQSVSGRTFREVEQEAMKVSAKSRKEYFQDLIKSFRGKYNMTEKQEKELLKKVEKDPEFARLLRSAPEKAIEKWLRDDFLTKNPAVRALLERMGTKLEIQIDDLAFEFLKDGGVKVTWKSFPETSMIVRGKHIFANGGSTVANGNMNQFLNHLIPGYKYTVDDAVTYSVDKLGRKVGAEADLDKLKSIERNNTRNKDVQDMVRSEGVKTDDGSHLISREMGGANEYINQVPFDGKIQRNGEWRRMEERLAKARSEGHNVKVKVTPMFKGTSMRPYKIRVEVTIDGVKQKPPYEFLNPIP